MALAAWTLSKSYQDGRVLSEAQLDTAFNSGTSWSASLVAKLADKTSTDTITGVWTLTTPKITGAGAGVATLQYSNTAANSTITFPDAGGSDSVVYLALAQTISGKTYTAPIVGSGSFSDQGDQAAAATFNLALADHFRVRLTGGPVALTFSNPGDRKRFIVEIAQDTSGSRTVTWPTSVRWLNASGATDSTTDKPTLTTTASKVDMFSFVYNSTLGFYYGSILGFKGAIT